MDDKCKVALGIAAATKQTPILMRTEARVRLPDHDFVVADRHKLNPSVISLHDITPNKFADPSAVSYKGHTFINIRSVKHDTVTAYDHGCDVLQMFNNTQDLKPTLWCPTGPKPVLLVRQDGGLDGNITTYPAVITWSDIFVRLDLDLLVVSMSASGASAHNAVERRMSGLSLLMIGCVFPLDHYGSHLDENGNTIDLELERRNFKKAGQDLAQLWSRWTIDGCKTIAECVEPTTREQKKSKFTVRDAKWRSDHVRHGKYTLVITKCEDDDCTTRKPLRSNIKDILPNGQWPSPCYYSHSNGTATLGNKHRDPPPGHHYARFHQMVIFQRYLAHSDGYDDDYNPLFSE